jgi:hypothetical protein
MTKPLAFDTSSDRFFVLTCSTLSTRIRGFLLAFLAMGQDYFDFFISFQNAKGFLNTPSLTSTMALN